MGDLRNGGSPPDDGGESYARDLPELPPEWGKVVIPDDLSGLDAEVRAVRRELRRGSGEREPLALRVPVAIMVVAVLMALVSLAVMTWGRPLAAPLPVVSLSATASIGGPDLSDVVLRDASGSPTALGTLLPAVVLLVERCGCPDLVRDVARSAPAAVTVVVIGLASPGTADFPANVRLLSDPAARLASLVGWPSGTGATAIVIDAEGHVVTVVKDVRSAAGLPPIPIG